MDFYSVQDALDRVKREVNAVDRDVQYDLRSAYRNGQRSTVKQVRQLRQLLEETAAELKEGGY